MMQGAVCHGVPAALLPTGVGRGPYAYQTFRDLIDAYRFDRPAGFTVKLEGEATATVYYLVSGWLVLSKSTANGHRQIVDVVLPGGILDPVSADACTSIVEIEPLTDVSFAAVPREDWHRMLSENPSITREIDIINRAAIARMFERMLRLGKGSAESIIAFAIYELHLRSTVLGMTDGYRLRIPMTQQQLGDFCGLSAVHVCRTLRRLKRHGVLEVTDHMDIRIRDIDALTEIAGIDPDALRQEIIPAA